MLEIDCGGYGVFQMASVSPPPDSTCLQTAGGVEAPGLYAAPGPMPIFPAPAPSIRDIAFLLKGNFISSRPTVSELDRVATSVTGATAAQAHPIDPVPTPWVSVIDFLGPHGDSVTWLADEVSGAAQPAVLSALDDPDLAPLGNEIGDFHVIANVCGVIDATDPDDTPRPTLVNMSFGRGVRAGDNASAASCDPNRAACQVARTIEYLADRGTRFVAGAGNHDEVLFPAMLDDVFAVGMLDVGTLLTYQQAIPAWETGAGVDGVLPGNGLCLNDDEDWAAPAGASYAAAILSGWFSKLSQQGLPTPSRGEQWKPIYSPEQDCFSLGNSSSTYSGCNNALEQLLDGLKGANEGACWALNQDPSVQVPVGARLDAPPTTISYDDWTTLVHPTPESDPCVPCGVDLGFRAAASWNIDMSGTEGLESGFKIDEVLLRSDDDYYAVPLAPGDLQAMAAGQIAYLKLDGVPVPGPPAASTSLWFRLRPPGVTVCLADDDCFWTSTPIFFKQ